MLWKISLTDKPRVIKHSLRNPLRTFPLAQRACRLQDIFFYGDWELCRHCPMDGLSYAKASQHRERTSVIFTSI